MDLELVEQPRGCNDCTRVETPEQAVIYQFQQNNVEPGYYFARGQLVRFADDVPEIIRLELGNLMVVVDDDHDLIVSFQLVNRTQIKVSLPKDSTDLRVICRCLWSGRRVEVPRGALVVTGEQMSDEVLDELLIGWTGKGLGLQTLQEPTTLINL